MSTAKRSRQRQSEAGAAASLPPTKKARTSKDSHAPVSGLGFLTDEKQRASKKLHASLTNGVKNAAADQPDESQATIASRPEVHNDLDMEDAMSQDPEADSSAEDNDDEEDSEPRLLTNGTVEHNLASDDDEEFDATEGAAESRKDTRQAAGTQGSHDDRDTEPTFADMLQASHPEAIDVQAAFAERNPESTSLITSKDSRALQAPSATSLGTVLTQALRTNDKELLESCFQMTDTASIRSTIQRLQSPLVASLLQRIAERLHKRPGRAGSLMVWVQWSLVAHGGYLAGQPEIMKKLKSLNQVVRERANGLQSLITLKGKLDMLSAQIELRRGTQAAARAQFDSDDEEAGVIYVEGEEDESSADEASGVEEAELSRRKRKVAIKHPRNGAVDIQGSSDEGDNDDAVMINGITNGIDDETSDGEDEEQVDGGFIDDEAEETSDEGEATSEDEGSEDELDAEDSGSDEDEAPPVKQGKPPQRSSLVTRRR